jgi:G3E family GTPase
MRTTIVCGVLGAGKTSFLQSTIKNRREKVAILVNDFGAAGIDGEILSVSGLEVVQLPSGCVCCTLRFDLIQTIEKLMNAWHPDHLMIEPSGVASPSGVLEALASLKIAPVTVVGIVDASEFIDFYESEMFGTFLVDQMVNSDVVLVNKTDLVDTQRVQKTMELVSKLNERAIVIATVNAVINEPLPVIEPRRTPHKRSAHSLHYEAISLTVKGPVGFEFVRRFFEDLAAGKYGRVARAKALVQTDRGPFRFDLASRRVDASSFKHPIQVNRLVVLGKGVNEASIRESCGSLARRS